MKRYDKILKAIEKLEKEAGSDMKKNMKVLAAKLKLYRTKKRLSQDQLADKLHVSTMSIIRWENAKTIPNQIAVEKMKELKIL